MRLTDTPQFQAAVPQMLVAAIERLAGARRQEDVIETLRVTARRLAGADGICIVLRDNGKCHYVEEDAISPLWKGGKFPMETCISGWAMMNRETAVIPDIFLDARIPHAIYRERFVKSLVMTPIGRDEPIAALGAYWARPYQAPPEVVQTLETLARAAATALENVHLNGALSASLRKTEMAREDLRHRLSNALSAIGSYSELAMSPDQARALAMRLKALERAHTVVDQSLERDASVSLAELVDAELAPYRSVEDNRIEVSGSDVTVSGAQAVALGLALNELAANSARAGALKSVLGKVVIRWQEAHRVVTLDWREEDIATAKRGIADNLNSNLVKRLVTSQLNGTMRGFVADGAVTCTIEFPNHTALEFPANVSVA